LLIQWPGFIEPGTTYSQPTITFDISATTLAAAGADTTQIDGVDLIPFLAGKKEGVPHETLFWRSRTMSNNIGVRHGDWKYVYSTEGEANPGPKQKPHQEMLFNLVTDVSETNNLALQQPEKLAELKRLYSIWSEEVDAECRALGLSPKQPAKAEYSKP
jgi:arylsulfatase A-like enzyme